MQTQWVALCRAGFERDLAAELREGLQAEPGTASNTGFVRFRAETKPGPHPWRALDLAKLVFARQLFLLLGEYNGAPDPEGAAEWVSRLLREVGPLYKPIQVLLEGPDVSGQDHLAPWEAVAEAISARLHGGRPVSGRPRLRLHLFVPPEGPLLVGLSSPSRSSPWPGGIPRLKLPPGQPSRSARKLEEALTLFVPAGEVEKRLRAGMRAVDLGAAPGGWSWILANRGFLVTSVDNGPMDGELMATGLVTHERADGFTFAPPQRVHWLVCDMVTGAPRAARLVANWLERGWFGEAIVNLKLGGANRLEQVRRIRATWERAAENAGQTIQIALKHLYHDREEVTAHLRLTGPAPKPFVPKATRVKRAKDKARPTPGGRSGGRARAHARVKGPSRKK